MYPWSPIFIIISFFISWSKQHRVPSRINLRHSVMFLRTRLLLLAQGHVVDNGTYTWVVWFCWILKNNIIISLEFPKQLKQLIHSFLTFWLQCTCACVYLNWWWYRFIEIKTKQILNLHKLTMELLVFYNTWIKKINCVKFQPN